MGWGLLVGLVLSALVVLGARAATRHGPVAWSTMVGIVLGCVVGGAAAARMGDPILIALYGLAIATAVAASAVDATEKRLPNALTYPLAGGGLVALGTLSALQGEGSLWRALAGCGIYGGWLFIASLTGLGPGDVKLAAGVGLWLGWLSWSTLLAGVAFGQILITICYLTGRRRASDGGGTPLGPAITAGFVLALLLVS
jgi:leader peptidase (prepilin peptidase)/N-methyltransferase